MKYLHALRRIAVAVAAGAAVIDLEATGWPSDIMTAMAAAVVVAHAVTAAVDASEGAE